MITPNLPVLLFKSYVPAHTRRMKNGTVVQVKAHYDKRSRKGVEHAPGHSHDTSHLTSDQQSLFAKMHGEQHFLHHYHGHALRKRVKEHSAKVAQHLLESLDHTKAGRHVEAAKSANKANRLKAQLIRHQKELADVNARVNGIAEMKNKLVAGSGAIGDSTDATHEHYASKVGAKWKPAPKNKPAAAKTDTAKAEQKGSGETNRSDDVREMDDEDKLIEAGYQQGKADAGEFASKSIWSILDGRNAVTIGKVNFDGTDFSIIIKRQKHVLDIFVKEKGGKPVLAGAANLDGNLGDALGALRTNLSDGAKITLNPESFSAKQKPADTKPQTPLDAVRQKLKSLKSAKYGAQKEKRIPYYEAVLNADPSKYSVGHGVAWKVPFTDQVNRGYRIVAIDAENKRARIKSVADTGITTSGGNHDNLPDQFVWLSDLRRDKKYDQPEPANKQVTQTNNSESMTSTVTDSIKPTEPSLTIDSYHRVSGLPSGTSVTLNRNHTEVLNPSRYRSKHKSEEDALAHIKQVDQELRDDQQFEQQLGQQLGSEWRPQGNAINRQADSAYMLFTWVTGERGNRKALTVSKAKGEGVHVSLENLDADKDEERWIKPKSLDTKQIVAFANSSPTDPPVAGEKRKTAPPPVDESNRTYLKVPYADKDHAKKHGAKWNPDKKQWYVIGDVPAALEKFAKSFLPPILLFRRAIPSLWQY